MSDTALVTPPAGEPGTPPAGTTNQETPQAGGSTQQAETISLEEARKLRNENQTLRKRAKDLEDAQLTEAEKLKKENAELKAAHEAAALEVRQMRAESALRSAGATAPDLLATKLSADALTDAKQMEKEVAALKRQYPALFAAQFGNGDGGAGGGSAPSQNMNDYIRRAAGR